MAKKKILSITEIEDKTKLLIENLNKESFIEDFLSLFDIPKTSITRAKKNNGDFLIRNKVRYKFVTDSPLHAIDSIEQEISNQNQRPRYLITTDFKTLYAKDTKTDNSLAINFYELPSHADFFLAWNGIEKVDYEKENPADIKAAERFTKLYDELIKINSSLAEEEKDGKSFNLFLIRVLFLLFSEDTEIIGKGSFTNILKTRTNEDGSNLNIIIRELFYILNIPEKNRKQTPEWLANFPYVNGNLFEEPHKDLNFNSYTRKLLIEAGELLKWNEINPDILGSMIQTVANKEERQTSGMHYTSVPNILKVIKPLFLDDLQSEYKKLSERADNYRDRKITEKHRREQQRDIIKQLNNLLDRMSKIKFLDPACGSGNFLIITYKELRKIEIKILQKIRQVLDDLREDNVYQGELLKKSKIKLSQFYGIEINDFAHDIAKLSLYIAEHQMNLEMSDKLIDYQPKILPLKEAGNIINGNALRINWNTLLSNYKEDELYIFGNPPYLGAKLQNKHQKNDLEHAIGNKINYKKLDYIAGWFYKASQCIVDKNASYAFVTTNSINQGEQVSILWNELLKTGEIFFAYKSFKWTNNATSNANVIVSIIGISNKNYSKEKKIYIEDRISIGENINPYLNFGENIIVKNSNTPINNLPEIVLGNKPVDFGFLIISEDDYFSIVNQYPELQCILKKYIGADDYINGTEKYAFWINDNDYQNLKNHPEVKKRVEQVRLHRLNGGSSARSVANVPYRFFTFQKFENSLSNHKKIGNTKMYSIIVPSTSSESRLYIPMGLVDETYIISSAAMVIYDAPIWLLGILESRMHMTWLQTIGGRLKTDYRYSAGMVYNTFPIPPLSTQRKNTLEEAVLEMLDVREEEGGTLAELYGGANKPMNERLRIAHEKIDGIVERAYRQEPFKSDEERLSTLLNLYQKMTSEEK
ncbi:class I SAM-dependent DNA methyltransferase [Vagococcus fluvialis]|uniref:class I SAM-dependent DNA methyltransferase n=1 Tax=Vagococcus fluvialis TaxID=2738 RepID=UPI0024322899|nr:DNA methyltransferase [Vagococcus fluvialis]